MNFDYVEKLASGILHLTGHGGWYCISVFLLGFFVLFSIIPFFGLIESERWRSFTGNEGWYLFFLATIILACKLPTLILHQCNPDESEWIAGAITLAKDLRFWHSVDGTTSGPLLFIPLLVVKLLTGHLGYASAKLVNLICWFFIYRLAYGIFSYYTGKELARIVLLPMILFYCLLVHHFDFSYYQSEVLPVLLITTALYFYTRFRNGNHPRLKHLMIAVFLIGCIPFAKLQLVPVAFFIGTWMLIENFRNYAKWIIPAALLPAVLCFIYLIATNLGGDFYHSYIQNNFNYSNQNLYGVRSNSFLKSIIQFPDWAFQLRHLGLYIWISLLAPAAMIVFISRKKYDLFKSQRSGFLFFSLLLLISFYSVIAPRNHFHHYFIVLFIPLGLMSGYSLIILLRSLTSIGEKRIAVILFILLTCSSNLLQYNHFFYSMKHPDRSAESELFVNFIRAHPVKGDRLAIWGWEPHYNVETELPQGVRDAHTYYAIMSDDPYFLHRYAADLNRNLPRYFLDATGPGNFFFKENKFRHENYPEVNAIIADKYSLVLEQDSTRLYRLK